MNLVPVPFHDDTLWAGEEDGIAHVAITPICNNLGLDPQAQRRRIDRDEILSQGVAIIATPSPGGMQETVCLPLPLIPGFLFGIDDRRVTDPVKRAKVLSYKRECHAVLYRHFFEGSDGERGLYDEGPLDLGLSAPGPLTERQTRLALDQVSEIRMLFGAAAAREAWASLGLIRVPAMAGGPDDAAAPPSRAGLTAADDPVARFAADGVERERGTITPTADLWAAFLRYCVAHDLEVPPRRAFEVRFARMGFAKRRSSLPGRPQAYPGIRPRDPGAAAPA